MTTSQPGRTALALCVSSLMQGVIPCTPVFIDLVGFDGAGRCCKPAERGEVGGRGWGRFRPDGGGPADRPARSRVERPKGGAIGPQNGRSTSVASAGARQPPPLLPRP